MDNSKQNEVGFKDYVDDYIRRSTNFKSADDLLKTSEPSMKFVLVCMVISAVFFFLLFLCVGAAIGGAVMVGILFSTVGYLISFWVASIKRKKFADKFTGKTTLKINKDELTEFLNFSMNIFPEYFHEWAGMIFVREGGQSTLVNNQKDEYEIGTEFGKVQSIAAKTLFAKIYVYHENHDAQSGTICYSFQVSPKIMGKPSFKSYKGAVKAIPVMRAAMEYYINVYKSGEKTDSTNG